MKSVQSIEDTKYLSLFSSNVGKYGPENTLYLDTFHVVKTMCQFELIWGHSKGNNRFQKLLFVDISF